MREDTGWRRTLIALQVVLAASAVYGSLGLALQLDGFDMPIGWLHPLPVDSWVLPGVALLVVVAVPLAAAALAGWRHYRRTAALSWLAADLLLGWLIVQLLIIGIRAPVQVVTFALAAVLVWVTAHSTRVRP